MFLVVIDSDFIGKVFCHGELPETFVVHYSSTQTHCPPVVSVEASELTPDKEALLIKSEVALGRDCDYTVHLTSRNGAGDTNSTGTLSISTRVLIVEVVELEGEVVVRCVFRDTLSQRCYVQLVSSEVEGGFQEGGCVEGAGEGVHRFPGLLPATYTVLVYGLVAGGLEDSCSPAPGDPDYITVATVHDPHPSSVNNQPSPTNKMTRPLVIPNPWCAEGIGVGVCMGAIATCILFVMGIIVVKVLKKHRQRRNVAKSSAASSQHVAMEKNMAYELHKPQHRRKDHTAPQQALNPIYEDLNASGDEVDGPSNKAPITGHSLRVVIGKTGVSVGSLISVLLLICLVVGKRIRDRCDSASYPVKELEKRQRECGTPRTTIFINPIYYTNMHSWPSNPLHTTADKINWGVCPDLDDFSLGRDEISSYLVPVAVWTSSILLYIPRSVGKHSLPAVSVVVSYGFHICLHFLALSIRLSVLHLSLPLASPTVPPTDTATPDGDGGEGEGGHGNEAPITGHTLAVVIGVSVGCLIALVVVICLVVVRGLKHSYGGSSSYSVSHMENQQKDTTPSTTNPISTEIAEGMANGTGSFTREEPQPKLKETNKTSPQTTTV
ncbi:hypothetical protein GBAR_LOCUS5341 [Geodia barretti]|nr:hypothetical protein GBAR_LOCUS5341 [Geodia barretti]